MSKIPDELRQDLDQAMRFFPCRRLVLQSMRAGPVVPGTWRCDYGAEDNTADRMGYRMRLCVSLDRIYAGKDLCGCLEDRAFSIANERFTVGSHDFYIAYATRNHVGLTIDTGHFHPTENYADKKSAVCPFVNGDVPPLPRRPLGLRPRAHTGRSHAPAGIPSASGSISSTRRSTASQPGSSGCARRQSILTALLEPTAQLQQAEYAGSPGLRMAMLGECRSLSVNAVWDHLCCKKNAGVGMSWLDDMDRYEHRA